MLQVHSEIKYASSGNTSRLGSSFAARSAGKESTSIRKNWMLAPNFLPAHLRGLKAPRAFARA